MINNLLTAVSQQRAERLICRKSRVSFHDEAVLSDTVFRPRDVTIRNSANALIGGRNMAGRPNSICDGALVPRYQPGPACSCAFMCPAEMVQTTKQAIKMAAKRKRAFFRKRLRGSRGKVDFHR